MPEQEELFAAVDALLAEAAQEALPAPDERKRLREAAGLSQEQIAKALSVRRETVTAWESGRTDPRPPKRAAYARLLDGLAERHPPSRSPSPSAPPSVSPAQPSPPSPAPPVEAPAAVPAAGPAAPVAVPVRKTAPLARPRSAPAPAASPAGPVDPRFAHGPLAVLDGDGNAYCADGLVLDCPAGDVPSLVEWALSEARIGAPRLHRYGKDADPLVVLTEAAAVRLGLPAELADRRGLRLPDDHAVVRAVTRAKWRLTRRGFGPWARIYRPTDGGRRQCVQLAVVPWGALDSRAWGGAAELAPPDLAAALTAYATRVLTPCGSTAVSGLELMTALRPPTRAVRDASTDTWVPGPVPGSLTAPVDPAPPEAPDEHPVVAARCPRGHARTPAEVLVEEAYDWIRDPELLTDDECALPYAVGIDVNMAFAAAANRLTVGLGAPVHRVAPVFDKKVAGCWLVDLSPVELDPRLPSPFTPHGGRPEGPAWYATPTVAYAEELGHRVRPVEAYVRPDSGPYLDAWYTRLRDAYMLTMERLGVRAGLSDAEFLAAMERHREADPREAAVLAAVKSTVKGGIGKLRERPQGAGYRPGERWPALERPTWRPDIRAAVISAARVNMHRKMVRLTRAGLYPIAVLSDCAVYLSPGPGPLDLLPRTADGKPLPGGFRLGVSPGMVKHEGTQSLVWAVRMLDEGHNPARHIKGTDAAAGGE
ncbi:telomere-associated protein Tap [Streptomyces sp. NPDC047928]|uniref:telomere-associated protein Tap n=1 Tax=unclassified Streptomyces TaxID=2593676 RepID=UPI0037152829